MLDPATSAAAQGCNIALAARFRGERPELWTGRLGRRPQSGVAPVVKTEDGGPALVGGALRQRRAWLRCVDPARRSPSS